MINLGPDIINLILSYYNFCIRCDKNITFTDEVIYLTTYKESVCKRCKRHYKVCNTCNKLFNKSIYCESCGKMCLVFCKNCIII